LLSLNVAMILNDSEEGNADFNTGHNFQVEISRGCGLYLEKVAKAKIIVESGSDPY